MLAVLLLRQPLAERKVRLIPRCNLALKQISYQLCITLLFAAFDRPLHLLRLVFKLLLLWIL